MSAPYKQAPAPCYYPLPQLWEIWGGKGTPTSHNNYLHSNHESSILGQLTEPQHATCGFVPLPNSDEFLNIISVILFAHVSLFDTHFSRSAGCVCLVDCVACTEKKIKKSKSWQHQQDKGKARRTINEQLNYIAHRLSRTRKPLNNETDYVLKQQTTRWNRSGCGKKRPNH